MVSAYGYVMLNIRWILKWLEFKHFIQKIVLKYTVKVLLIAGKYTGCLKKNSLVLSIPQPKNNETFHLSIWLCVGTLWYLHHRLLAHT